MFLTMVILNQIMPILHKANFGHFGANINRSKWRKLKAWLFPEYRNDLFYTPIIHNKIGVAFAFSKASSYFQINIEKCFKNFRFSESLNIRWHIGMHLHLDPLLFSSYSLRFCFADFLFLLTMGKQLSWNT